MSFFQQNAIVRIYTAEQITSLMNGPQDRMRHEVLSFKREWQMKF